MQPRLPLNNLNTFAEAARHLSFRKAAEALHVTPSAVSHQVRNLEDILGYKLFDRLDKAVRLTPRGERLFADIRAPLSQLHDAGRRAARGREDNSLALSVAPAFATGWLLPRLRDFHAQHPEISLSVVASTELVDLDRDPFDASIRMGRGDWAKLEAERLFEQVLVVVCHPALPGARRGLLSPAQVAGYTLVENIYLPDIWENWFRSAGVDYPAARGDRLQVQGNAQVVEALQSADTLGLVDRNFIGPDLASGRLAIACEHELRDGRGYYLGYAKSGNDSPALRLFRDWLFSRIAADGGRHEPPVGPPGQAAASADR